MVSIVLTTRNDDQPATIADSGLYCPSIASLAWESSDFQQVEEWIESYYDLPQRGYSYDDLIDKLDGATWDVEGERRTLDLPSTYSHPVVKRIRSIMRRVVREVEGAHVAA